MMKHTQRLRGFTLIELLVVIAIIGILASVVLASLNTARDKGKDAAGKSSISQARSASEIVYSSNGNSYVNMCPDQATAVMGTAPKAVTIRQALVSAGAAYGVAFATANYDSGNVATPNAAGDTACQADNNEYVMQVFLSNGSVFCIDSAGTAGERAARAANLADADRDCTP